MGDRCTGRCCQAFPIDIPPERLFGEPHRQMDGEFMAEALIHLGVLTESPHTGKPHGPLDYYTCRHFDEVAGACRAYERRPRMCREYPYGSPCEHEDACEWTRAGEATEIAVSFQRLQQAAQAARQPDTVNLGVDGR